jgi:hypothetical protein
VNASQVTGANGELSRSSVWKWPAVRRAGMSIGVGQGIAVILERV